MTTAHELESCPFCGVTLVFDASMGEGGRWVHPHSGEDEADPGEVSCILSAYMVRNRPASIARWNRREAATALSEAKAENERLTRERDGLREALKRVDRTLTVPAAEYVPAIGDAFDIITEALK